jgi:hypothetical protein
VSDISEKEKEPNLGLLRMRIQAMRGNGTALVPCIQEKCPRWKEGEGRSGCILLIKAGKHGSIDGPRSQYIIIAEIPILPQGTTIVFSVTSCPGKWEKTV